MVGWKKVAAFLCIWVGFFLFTGWLVYWKGSKETNRRQVTIAELEQIDDVSSELPYEELLELADAQPIGDACVIPADHKRVDEYQLLKPTDANARAVIAHLRRKPNGSSLRSLIEEEVLLGRAFEYSSEGAERLEHLRTSFPNIDLERAIYVSRYRPRQKFLSTMFWAFMAPGFVWVAFSVVRAERKRRQQDEKWNCKLDQDRKEEYAAHTAAMRLIAEQEHLMGSQLQTRRIDSNFDVPGRPPVKQARFKGAAFKYSLIAFFWCLGPYLHYLIKRCDFYRELSNEAGLAIGIGSVFIQSLGALIAILGMKRVVGQQEEKLSINKAKYRELAYHQYHSAVLRELGFTEVGDYVTVGASAPLVRTIFLSRRKNLLVEVGLQSSVPYFCLETLLNDGRFLETHSMITESSEQASPLAKLLRKSASHQDILKAMDEHDQLVSEFTGGGGILEAEFTVERFPRFLAWATSDEILGSQMMSASKPTFESNSRELAGVS